MLLPHLHVGFCRLLFGLLLGLAQEIDLLPQGFLHHFSYVLEQMPPIKHLLSLWRSFCCANPVAGTPVTADDIDAFVSSEPLFEGLLIAAHEEIDNPMLL